MRITNVFKFPWGFVTLSQCPNIRPVSDRCWQQTVKQIMFQGLSKHVLFSTQIIQEIRRLYPFTLIVALWTIMLRILYQIRPIDNKIVLFIPYLLAQLYGPGLVNNRTPTQCTNQVIQNIQPWAGRPDSSYPEMQWSERPQFIQPNFTTDMPLILWKLHQHGGGKYGTRVNGTLCGACLLDEYWYQESVVSRYIERRFVATPDSWDYFTLNKTRWSPIPVHTMDDKTSSDISICLHRTMMIQGQLQLELYLIQSLICIFFSCSKNIYIELCC